MKTFILLIACAFPIGAGAQTAPTSIDPAAETDATAPNQEADLAISPLPSPSFQAISGVRLQLAPSVAFPSGDFKELSDSAFAMGLHLGYEYVLEKNIGILVGGRISYLGWNLATDVTAFTVSAGVDAGVSYHYKRISPYLMLGYGLDVNVLEAKMYTGETELASGGSFNIAIGGNFAISPKIAAGLRFDIHPSSVPLLDVGTTLPSVSWNQLSLVILFRL